MLLSMLADYRVTLVDTRGLAESAGSVLTQNVVLLGAVSAALPLRSDSLREAIRQTVPGKTIDLNLKAFDLGRESVPAR